MAKKPLTILANTVTYKMPVGKCPGCGAILHNPSREERIGLSMTIRWGVTCPGCGAQVTVENPRCTRRES